MAYRLSKMFTIELECDTSGCNQNDYYTSRNSAEEAHNKSLAAGWTFGYYDFCPVCTEYRNDTSKDKR